MKTKFWAISLVSIVNLVSLAFAADPAPKADAPPAAAPSAAPAPSPVSLELSALFDKVKAKLAAGQNTEAALADDIKQFDVLLEKYKGQKTEDVAQILMLKSLLYIQVLSDFDKGEASFRRLAAEFPDTEAGKKATEVLPMIAQQKAAMQQRAALKPGAVFPDFKETDVAGQPLSLSKYKGKVVLVDFWATWCGPCVAELPNVIAAYQKFHDKGFEIVGISLDKDKAALEKFTKEKGMTWSQYFDGKGWESKLGQQYGITSIPATFLLDGEGKIIAADLRGPALEAELTKQLAGK